LEEVTVHVGHEVLVEVDEYGVQGMSEIGIGEQMNRTEQVKK
jgi:hypothetical protein